MPIATALFILAAVVLPSAVVLGVLSSIVGSAVRLVRSRSEASPYGAEQESLQGAP